MSWADIEDAMQSAVALASGLDPQQVVWSYQNVNEPASSHIVITFGGEIPIGMDRISTTTDLTRPNGQEVKQEVKGVREVPFEIECFTPATSGDSAARRIVELTKTRLRLPTARYTLRKAGLSPFDPGAVNWIPDIPSAVFRGRAVCTIRCYVPVMDCIEYAGYIARVTGALSATGGASGTIQRTFDSSV